MNYQIKLFIIYLAKVFEYAIVIRCLLSFIPDLRNNKIVNIIYQITDPIIMPCSRLLDKLGLNMGMIDFSPIVAFFLIKIIVTLIVYI